jgi:hypothetical protein
MPSGFSGCGSGVAVFRFRNFLRNRFSPNVAAALHLPFLSLVTVEREQFLSDHRSLAGAQVSAAIAKTMTMDRTRRMSAVERIGGALARLMRALIKVP